MTRWLLGALLLLSVTACKERRERAAEPVTYALVESTLQQRCATCHGSDRAEGGYRVSSYYEAIGCADAGRAVVLPSSEQAPLVAVLARPDHHGLLSDREREALTRWLVAGVPGRPGLVHGLDIMNPRAAGWHGKLASAEGFAPLREPAGEGVCGRCHDGAPVRPAEVRSPAPGAPACTSCHQQQTGVLACATCHGSDQRSQPPRDACYFDVSGDAHDAHLSGTRFRLAPLACETCHPTPGDELFSGSHADGVIDVQLSLPAQGAPQFDATSGSCAHTCHDLGGEHPQPAWTTPLALDCSSCHQSPPRDHYPGSCNTCHAELGSTPDLLLKGPLHLDGKVDLGNGDGTCGACHGQAGDPWPRDPLHRAHRDSLLTRPIACDTCHAVPMTPAVPGHLDGQVGIQVTGRALAGLPASFDTASKRCSNVACHAGSLPNPAAAPSWLAPLEVQGCRGCHSAPPAPPHVQQESCGGGLCHGAEVSGAVPSLGITSAGRSLHIDGEIQAGAR